MVSFRSLAVATLAAFAVPAFAAITPAQVVENLRMLTTKSQALQAPAQQINVVNGPLIIIGQGPFPVRVAQLHSNILYSRLTTEQQIIVGFSDIITTTTNAIATMQGSAPVKAGADADAIFDAFREVCCE
jgi:hypothetical protein